MLLVPSDPLRPRRADEHFAAEAHAARQAGLDVALVDHDALVHGDPERGVACVPPGGVAWYRGWMLPSEQYERFAYVLARKGVTMRTTAAQYRRAHELPGWCPTLAAVTPHSAWTTGPDRADFDQVRLALGPGPAVLRDYVKSMKHYWQEAAFIPAVEDRETAWKIASRFLHLREDDFAGGFVLRRFERFISAEVRTWWVDGQCCLVGPHPDTPDDHPPADLDLAWLTPLIGALDLPFVAADLARRADDVWRVIEIGDGQVSDRPVIIEPATLVTALLHGPRPTSTSRSRPSHVAPGPYDDNRLRVRAGARAGLRELDATYAH